MDSPQANAPLVVFLYQARNTNTSLWVSLIQQANVTLVVFLYQAWNTTLAYGRMRSKLDHHSAAGPTPAWSRCIQTVDGSHPHFRSLPSLQLCWWGEILTRKKPWTQLRSWNSPHSEPNSVVGISPLGGLNRHSVVGLIPARSRHMQFVAGSHPHFRSLSKFAGKCSGEPITARNIWHIHEGFLILDYPIDVPASYG